MLTEGDISRITDRIARGYGPLVVGTFGSYALGTPRVRSDLDVFVIKQTVEPPSTRRRAVMRLLLAVLHPLDVHVFTPEEFEENVGEELSFTWHIVRQARIYHRVPDADAFVPSLFSERP